MAQFSLILPDESRDLADDIRDLFDDLANSLEHKHRAFSGEWHPALDVLETQAAVEIAMDASGIPAHAVRILVRAGVVIIAGEKAPGESGGGHSYHLVEREFGRFARVVRVTGAFDIAAARATITNGELTLILPKIQERRGRAHRIAITDRPAPPA